MLIFLHEKKRRMRHRKREGETQLPLHAIEKRGQLME